MQENMDNNQAPLAKATGALSSTTDTKPNSARIDAKIITNQETILLKEGESILAALEDTGHNVEYQCKKGFCGSCRVKKIAGEVEYKETPLAFVSDDEILPCCATPKSNLRLDVNLRSDIKKPNVA